MSHVKTVQGGETKVIPIEGDIPKHFQPEARRRWLILIGQVFLDTSGIAGNRRITVHLHDERDTWEIELGKNSQNIIASKTGCLTFFGSSNIGVNWEYGDPNADFNSFFSLEPGTFYLEENEQLEIHVEDLKAGDKLRGFLRVLEYDLSRWEYI